MIKASCHCGAVQFEVDAPPGDVNSCNCSVCRRYGALWAYYQRPEERFAIENGVTDIYSWGDRDLEFHRCRVCGCVTYWMAVDRTYECLGINARLMPPELLDEIPVRYSDGASM
jgi:hypothetical protein